MRVEVRPCAFCGSLFTPRKTTSKFCSLKCVGLSVPPRYGPLEPRFWAKVNKNGPVVRDGLTSCWEWTASSNNHGYGAFGRHGRRDIVRASHMAWEIATGEPVPHGLWVLHVCDNPACVRNDDKGIYSLVGEELPRYGHLFLGTAANNSRDKALKGRGVIPDQRGPRLGARGERNHRHKLTDEQVLEIRRIRATRAETLKELAARYQVSFALISQIATGRIWAWLQ